MFSGSLTFAQTSNNAIATLQNLPGAFNQLLKLTEEKYSIDYTLIDMNPSLSAINQNLFITSHAFIVPTNPDPFSIMAINTLEHVLPRWTAWSRNSAPLFVNSAYPLPSFTPKFLGSLIQRFNIRRGKAAKPFLDNIIEIKSAISGSFFEKICQSGMALKPDQYPQALVEKQYCLAEIPDFQGLLPKAYDVGVPVFEITDDEISETGHVLDNMKSKRDQFSDQFGALSEILIELMRHA